ncbi:single-stranded DNA-binding protein 3-like isoform X12 [Acanthaster planci]|uniref:Single-stranded DNA-binding protein 3-like isoform X12 n=1 Tax=Acanthaster planci TaxID=133434 RepID=A0A8B7ZAI4_ACAPL|nr:single-stranded DNA-binding protein 3-like isoform X12 [Acanthaster planci]
MTVQLPSMFPKGKGSTVPSDSQAREKLALYVYEYLLHVGAQKSAQTFLSETPQIRWEKNITLGEPPGFLHSWWCVFWDLYCAAPERRETCEHSSEAKAFHDYKQPGSKLLKSGMIPHSPSERGRPNPHLDVNGEQPVAPFLHKSGAAPSPVLGQMPPNDGMPPSGPMPPGFFQLPPHHMDGNQLSPHPMDMNQPFMSPRYSGPRGGPVRMPGSQPPPGGIPNSQGMMPNSMDPTRPGFFAVKKEGHPSMGGPMPRMNHPRMPMQPNGSFSPQNYGGGMRPPPGSMPGGMPLPMPGGRPWNPNTSTVNYSRASPGGFVGPPGSGGPPGTPIMPSPQGTPQAMSSDRRMSQGSSRRDSTNSGDNMYTMMKPVPGGNMGPGNFPMGSGPDGPMPMGSQDIPPVMNGEMDGMPKSSPASNQGPGGPGTPREDNGDMSGQLFPNFQDNDQNESAAILKIKEKMEEEAKRFEKETPGEHPDYFMHQP